MPFELKSPTMVKKMKKGEMFEHISELFNVVDLMIISSSSRRLHAWRAQSMCTGYVHVELDRPLVSCLIVFRIIVRYCGF